MSRIGKIGHALFSGEVSYDFVGKRRRWYAISAVFLVLAAVGLFGRGLNLGIEFKGGAEFSVPHTTATVEQARAAAESAGIEDPIVQQVGPDRLTVQTPALTVDQTREVTAALAEGTGVPASDISVQVVGPSWGQQITSKAVQGLVIFLVLLTVFLSIYFEWKMALAAILGMLHDIFLTVGIYALTGIEVTPATVIGVLTILGFSLYDNVVVFDKVKENTRGIASSNRMTYSEAANLAVNQTVVRSLNTSIVALLPVGAILVIGVGLLGAGTLKDLALALFIGTAAGTYSSLFIATPLLCEFKEREPAMKALAARVAARRAGLDAKGARTGTRKRAGASGAASGRAGSTTAVLEADDAVEPEGDEDGAGDQSGDGATALPTTIVAAGAAGTQPGQAAKSGRPGQSDRSGQQRQQPRQQQRRQQPRKKRKR
jgi:preprotein translocase subunit SecF